MRNWQTNSPIYFFYPPEENIQIEVTEFQSANSCLIHFLPIRHDIRKERRNACKIRLPETNPLNPLLQISQWCRNNWSSRYFTRVSHNWRHKPLSLHHLCRHRERAIFCIFKRRNSQHRHQSLWIRLRWPFTPITVSIFAYPKSNPSVLYEV